MRGLEIRDLDRRGARVRDKIDEERNTGAVAVIDVAGVDDHRARRRVGKRAMGVGPQGADRAGVETSRQRENAAPVWRVVDRERGHGEALARYSISSTLRPEMRTRSPSCTYGSNASDTTRVWPLSILTVTSQRGFS